MDSSLITLDVAKELSVVYKAEQHISDRHLLVDKGLMLPSASKIRMITYSTDVIHS